MISDSSPKRWDRVGALRPRPQLPGDEQRHSRQVQKRRVRDQRVHIRHEVHRRVKIDLEDLIDVDI